MNFRNTLMQLLNTTTDKDGAELPLLNKDGGALMAVSIASAMLNAGLIDGDATLCYEKHPIRTSQVFDEATTVELINTNGHLGHVVKFAVGDYFVFFDASKQLRVATYNTRSMKLWA